MLWNEHFIAFEEEGVSNQLLCIALHHSLHLKGSVGEVCNIGSRDLCNRATILCTSALWHSQMWHEYISICIDENEQNWKVGLAHHKMGNSQVLFMICGSSQVSLPVMLYPFSLIIQQYSQGAEPEQQCVGSDVQCYDSFINPPVQLRSRSTSFPCFSKVSPTNDILPGKWLIVCQKCKLLTYRLFWDNPLLKDRHLHPFGWPL